MFKAICISMIVLIALSCKNNASQDKNVPELVQDTIQVQPVENKINLDAIFEKSDDHYIIPWSLLTKIDFEKSYLEKMQMEMTLPVFGDTLKALDHQNVQIEGFYIPVDETGDDKIVILSAYPFAQCFFCGKAGVESIIDVLPLEKLPTLKVDRKLKFRGKLKLNRDDFDYLIYILEDARMVK